MEPTHDSTSASKSSTALEKAEQEYRFMHFAGLALVPALCGGFPAAIAIPIGIAALDVVICRKYARVGTPPGQTFTSLLARIMFIQAITIALILAVGYALLLALFTW